MSFPRLFRPITVVLIPLLWGSGCVMSSTHQLVLADLDETRNELTSTRETLKATNQTLEQSKKQGEQCTLELTTSRDQNATLVSKVADMENTVNQLGDEKGLLAAQIGELNRIRKRAEQRNAEYQTLLSKLSKMIDAGTLNVKIRNGRMLVEMSSDVVFPPGGTHIKQPAQEAIEELAATISQFADRRFQVVGHSDPTPISTARFPSNWELSSQRATEVVKLLVAAGVPAEMLTAAGQAEFDPLVDNETPEGRSTNRRVEIVFVPTIEDLPGFDQTTGTDTKPAPTPAASAPQKPASAAPSAATTTAPKKPAVAPMTTPARAAPKKPTAAAPKKPTAAPPKKPGAAVPAPPPPPPPPPGGGETSWLEKQPDDDDRPEVAQALPDEPADDSTPPTP